ncbi:hypothetical protein [Rufibacter immobilis]|uniref:hypothetical protein n=1 Tax=Rufibacter immobilis TaxID=1348778 RepID=UPI0035E96F5B
MKRKRITGVLAVLMLLAFGCGSDKSEDPEPQFGSVEVRMSYFYNDFQGYKPDTGADIYLFKETGKKFINDWIDYRIGTLRVEGTEEKVKYDFAAEADVSGVAKIENVPYGKYILVAASKGRFTYSKKSIEINSVSQSHVKNFGYRSEFSDIGEVW